jgi:hypothetical protein
MNSLVLRADVAPQIALKSKHKKVILSAFDVKSRGFFFRDDMVISIFDCLEDSDRERFLRFVCSM